ncbi:hypothetical protein BESB_010660 [Besnoitia besnoiti]|uniref:Transmembrane protein n=1 Tax=Besnoitia besnoiti TaxID=94643 RepID=A0A2A9MMV9_BESBE|nr:hypothetical protein BESB_010660 [Besnoitia besnoiti]PFH38724.1 hypothetical protein BESB_010660 [Besnoitia besnoiti]
MLLSPIPSRGLVAHRFFILIASIAEFAPLCSCESDFLYDVRISLSPGVSADVLPDGELLGRLSVKEYIRQVDERPINPKDYFSSGPTGAIPTGRDGPIHEVRAHWMSFSDGVLSSAVQTAQRYQDALPAGAPHESNLPSTYPLLSLRLIPAVVKGGNAQQTNKSLPPSLEASVPVSFVSLSPAPGDRFSSTSVCGASPPFLLSLHLSPSFVPFSASIQRLQGGDSWRTRLNAPPAGTHRAPERRVMLTCPESPGSQEERDSGRTRVPALQVVLPPSNVPAAVPVVPAFFPGETHQRLASVGGAAGRDGGGESQEEEQPSFWRRNWWIIVGVLVMATIMGGDGGSAAPQTQEGAQGHSPSGAHPRAREGSDRRR